MLLAVDLNDDPNRPWQQQEKIHALTVQHRCAASLAERVWVVMQINLRN